MKKQLYIFLFLLPLVSKTQSFSTKEQFQIDSLNAIIANPNSYDTTLASSYIELSNILYISNLDTLLALSLKAQHLMQKNIKNGRVKNKKRYKKYLAYALLNKGAYYSRKGNLALALEFSKKALVIQIEISDKEGEASAYKALGLDHKNQSNIASALKYLHKSLKLNEVLKNEAEIVSCVVELFDISGDLHVCYNVTN